MGRESQKASDAWRRRNKPPCHTMFVDVSDGRSGKELVNGRIWREGLKALDGLRGAAGRNRVGLRQVRSEGQGDGVQGRVQLLKNLSAAKGRAFGVGPPKVRPEVAL